MSEVATIAAAGGLASLNANVFPNGRTFYVHSVRDTFRLDNTSSATADGISIVTPGSGAGRWFRLNQPHPSWRFQATWVIDPVSGNDENNGVDSGHAIRTLAERQRRCGRGYDVPQPTTITYLSTPPSTDVEMLSNVGIGTGARLDLVGARTVVATGTLTGFTPKNRTPPNPTKNTIADTGLAGGFAPHVGRLCRITSGSRANVAWVISKDLGSGVAEISTPGTVNPTVPGSFTAFTRGTPQIGDPYEIVTLPVITCGSMKFRQAASQMPSTGFGFVRISNLEFDFGNKVSGLTTDFANGISCENIPVLVYQCILGASEIVTFHPQSWYQNYYRGYTNILGGSIAFRAGAHTSHVQANAGARVVVDFDELLQGGELTCFRGGIIEVGSCAVFDKGGPAVACNPGGIVAMITNFDPEGSFLWGTGNTQQGILVQPGAQFWWYTGSGGNAPTVNSGLGLNREVSVGGREILYSDGPVEAGGAFYGVGWL